MADSISEDEGCRLLNLAPELRNRIYHYALVEEDAIEVEAGTNIPRPPALLHTCRQLRAEANDTYYAENSFAFVIREFDATMYIRFCTRLPSHGIRRNATFNFHDATNWPNLLKWMKAIFDERCMGPFVEEGLRQDVNDVPGRMFTLVKRLQADLDASWEEVEQVLEDVHGMLASVDSRWV